MEGPGDGGVELTRQASVVKPPLGWPASPPSTERITEPEAELQEDSPASSAQGSAGGGPDTGTPTTPTPWEAPEFYEGDNDDEEEEEEQGVDEEGEFGGSSLTDDSPARPPPPPWSHRVIRLATRALQSRVFQVWLFVLTLYILFANDVRIVAFTRAADPVFEVLSTLCLFSFFVETLMRSLLESEVRLVALDGEEASGGKVASGGALNAAWRCACCGRRRRLHLRGYFLSFIFWLDLLALVSLLPEINWIWGALLAGAGPSSSLSAARASRISRIGSRLGRIIRMVRVVRVMKLYSIWTSRERSGKGVSYIPRESALAQQLNESTTRTIILLVLLMLLLIPVFTYSPFDAGRSAAAESIHVANTVRVAAAVAAAAAGGGGGGAPSSVWAAGAGAAAAAYRVWSASDAVLPSDVGTQYIVRLVLLPAVGVPAFLSVDDPGVYDTLRSDATAQEMEQYVFNSTVGGGSGWAATTVWFNIRPIGRVDSVYTISLTLFVVLLLLLGALQFSADAQALVLRPIEVMLDFVEKVTLDPAAVWARETSSRDNTGTYEIKVLENALKKVVGVLRVGLGSGGLLVVARHLDARRQNRQQQQQQQQLLQGRQKPVTALSSLPPSAPLASALASASLTGPPTSATAALVRLLSAQAEAVGAGEGTPPPLTAPASPPPLPSPHPRQGASRANSLSRSTPVTPSPALAHPPALPLGVEAQQPRSREGSTPVPRDAATPTTAGVVAGTPTVTRRTALPPTVTATATPVVAATVSAAINASVTSAAAAATAASVTAAAALSSGWPASRFDVSASTSLFEPFRPGRPVRAVFVDVGIPRFDSMVEVLGPRALPYFNRVAKIVHDCTLQWGGSVVHNSSSGTFTLVWLVDEAAIEAASAAALLASPSATVISPSDADDEAGGEDFVSPSSVGGGRRTSQHRRGSSSARAASIDFDMTTDPGARALSTAGPPLVALRGQQQQPQSQQQHRDRRRSSLGASLSSFSVRILQPMLHLRAPAGVEPATSAADRSGEGDTGEGARRSGEDDTTTPAWHARRASERIPRPSPATAANTNILPPSTPLTDEHSESAFLSGTAASSPPVRIRERIGRFFPPHQSLTPPPGRGGVGAGAVMEATAAAAAATPSSVGAFG